MVMEYEAWFGPKAATFQGSAAMPLLQSKDMKPVGGGYDSSDPAVIKQHVAWMEYMGIDAATSEVTNNVSCIFDSEWFVKKYVKNCTPSFRMSNQIIRDNTGNLYPAWTKLGTRLGLIPLLGGIDENVLFKDIDGKDCFRKGSRVFRGTAAEISRTRRYLPRQAAHGDLPRSRTRSEPCRSSFMV